MPNIIQTEAIVLRKIELLEQDSMVTFFSKELGKIVCIAKGIRKFTSRRASHLQTGNLVDLILHSRNDYYYISQSNLISAFSAIKADPVKLDLLYKYLFIVDRLSPEREPEPQLYKEIIRELTKLSKSHVVKMEFFNEFCKKIMFFLGYQDNNEQNIGVIDQIQEIISERIPQYVIIDK